MAKLRDQKADLAVKKLNEILVPYGVEIEKLETKDYRFNSAYERAIEQKKVAEQKAEKAKAEQREKKELWKRDLQQAQGKVNQVEAQVDGEFKQAKIEADAYFDQQKKNAEAILIEGKAAAKSLRKKREALVGSGGDVMVRLAIARALKGKKIRLIPTGGGGGGGNGTSINFTKMDMNKFLEMEGMRSFGGKGSK